MTIKVSNEQDRRILAGILVANGYAVKIVRVKVGKMVRVAIEAKEESEDK